MDRYGDSALNFYKKYIKNKLFNKLTLLITGVYLLILLILGCIFGGYLHSVQLESDIDYFVRTIDELNEQFELITANAEKIRYDFYYELYNNWELLQYFSKSSDEFQRNKPEFMDYVSRLLNTYNNFQKVSFYRIEEQDLITAGKAQQYRRSDSLESIFLRQNAELFRQNGNAPIIMASPDIIFSSPHLRVVIPINEYYLSGRLHSYLIIDMIPSSLNEIVSKFEKDAASEYLAFNPEGSAIYDSEGIYSGTRPDIWETLREVPEFTISDSKRQYETMFLEGKQVCALRNSENDLGLNIVCLFSMQEITKNTRYILLVTFTFMLLAGGIGTVAIYFITKKVASRVYSLIKEIKTSRTDQMNRIPQKSTCTDEIEEIAQEFAEVFQEQQTYLKRAYEYEIQKKNISFQLLQSQINPHFLFNTLEAIRMKSVEEDALDTAQLIYALATLLRQSYKKQTVSSIGAELKYAEMYISLFQLRYPDRIHYQTEISPQLISCGILSNLLQPLIENCMVHGFDQSIPCYQISVSVLEEGQDIVIQIRDNGIGISQASLEKIQKTLETTASKNTLTRIGLTNVNDRIKIVYGDRYGVFLESVEGESTTVTMRLQKMTVDELKALETSIL